MDPPDYHRPGTPVYDAGYFACIEPGGRVLSVQFYLAQPAQRLPDESMRTPDVLPRQEPVPEPS